MYLKKIIIFINEKNTIELAIRPSLDCHIKKILKETSKTQYNVFFYLKKY